MKKLYALFLLVSASLFAQPALNPPMPILVCDTNNDGFELVDLSIRNNEILGALDPADHTLTFHNSFEDAQNNVNLLDPFGYTMFQNFVAFVRVYHNDDPNLASIVPLELMFMSMAIGSVTGGGTVCVNTEQSVSFLGMDGAPPYTFTYSINGTPSQTVSTSASGNIATISFPITVAGTFTVDLIEVQDGSGMGCTMVDGSLASATFTVMPSTNVSISGPSTFCQNSPATLTLTFNGGSPPYTASYGLNGIVVTTAETNSGSIEIPVNTQTPGTYVYQVMWATANGCEQSQSVDHLVIIEPTPTTVQAPDLVVEDQAPFDGLAWFDFSGQDAIYSQGASGLIVSYHFSEADAAAGINAILSPYSNVANPQQIWARVQGLTGCYYLDMFYLVVTPPGNDAIFIPDTNFKAALVAANPSVNTAMNAQNQNITVDTNGDGEIQISEASQIATLSVNALNINSLEGIKFFYNLKFLYCQDNSITALDLSAMPWLVFVQAMNNQTLQTVNVTGNTGLESLYVQTGSLTSLDASSCTNLAVLACFQNDLTTLNVQGLQNLAMLNCDFNQLTSLNVAGLASLTDLSCNFNQIASLEVSGLSSLTALSASVNMLTTIDVSQNTNLNLLNVEANQLETAFIKNGSNEDFLFGGNDNLTYICADLIQIEIIQNSIGFNDNMVVTPYCTEEPGGPYNTIYGTVRFDANNNGCDTSDTAQPFTKVRITDGTTNGYVFLNADLTYEFHTQEGDFQVMPDLENSTLFNVSPFFAAVSFPDSQNHLSVNNFCLTASGTTHDVEVVIAPLGVARPGFDAFYQIVIRNKGNQTESGVVTFNYNDAVTDFLTSVPVPSTSTAGQLTFNYANLAPFETRVMTITLNVNGPTETPPVNIADVLVFLATATLGGTDVLPNDNTFQFIQLVVGAYDPNDKQCIQGNVVSPNEIGKYLHYVINFENTGNFPAENVVVRDIIDIDKFDLSSLQIISASHAVTARVNGNSVEFFFKNINLGIGGHGNILLKIKTLETLVSGDVVTNKADIYFDYNYPIETNFAQTAFQELSTGDFGVVELSISPNPSNGLFTIKAKTEIDAIELYDVTGRLLRVSRPRTDAMVLDLTQRRAGIYLLKIKTAHGSAVRKIVNR